MPHGAPAWWSASTSIGLPDLSFRVNNGTPRPITVHEDLLENHFDLVVRFLEQTLRAADWAADNLEGVFDVLQTETFGSREAGRRSLSRRLS